MVDEIVVREYVNQVTVIRDAISDSVVRVDTRSADVVHLTSPQAVVVQGQGARGPQGPPGLAGPRIEFHVIAGFDIEAYRVVVPRLLDVGTTRYASNDNMLNVNKPMWLTLNSALVGEQLIVTSAGEIDAPDIWEWINGPIFLGQNGELTQVAPTYDTGALFVTQLGYPIGPNSMFFARYPSVVLSPP